DNTLLRPSTTIQLTTIVGKTGRPSIRLAPRPSTERHVVLCGTEPLVRAWLRSLIESRHGLRVVAELDSIGEVVEAASRLQPRLIVAGLPLPTPADPEFRRELRVAAPSAVVICVAPTNAPEWLRRAAFLGSSRVV